MLMLLMHKLGLMVRMGRTAGAAVLLASCLLQPARAFDSEKLEAALDSLNAARFPAGRKRAAAVSDLAASRLAEKLEGELTLLRNWVFRLWRPSGHSAAPFLRNGLDGSQALLVTKINAY